MGRNSKSPTQSKGRVAWFFKTRIAFRRTCVCALVLGACLSPRTVADEIEYGSTRVERIRIVDMEGASLAYRTPAGDYKFVTIGDIKHIRVDTVGSLRDFNEAEDRQLEGDFVRANVHYERAIRVATDFWVRLTRARWIRSCERAGRFDILATQFSTLLRDEEHGVRLAAQLLPATPVPPDSREVARALKSLEKARGPSSQSGHLLMELLEYALRSGERDAKSLAAARTIARAPFPLEIATRSVYRLKTAALRELLERDADFDVVSTVNAELANVADEVLPELLLIKAEAQLAKATNDEEAMRAGWSAMRVAIHFPADARTPEALLIAARVHERIDRNPTAIKLLRECVRHAGVDSKTKQRAQEMMSRLRASG